jgi:replicative DNA helicase
MESTLLQRKLIYWLTSPHFVDTRPDLISKVKPDLFDKVYREIWDFHVSPSKEKSFDYQEMLHCTVDFLGWEPYSPDETIFELKKIRAEGLITKDLADLYISDNKKGIKDKLRQVESIVVKGFDLLKSNEKTSAYDLIDEVLRLREEGGFKGISTSIPELDLHTGGLCKGHFWVIGGYTNVGKTGFMLKLANEVCKQGFRSIIYSLEMTGVNLVNRLLSLNEFELKDKSKALDKTAYAKLDIINNCNSLNEIINHIKAQKDKPDVVFIDFIQNIQSDQATEYERITYISLKLQELAISHNICIVGLSQLSNDAAENESKKVIGFKGSGALVAACDVGMVLIRKNDTIDLIIKKNRYGRQFNIPLAFDLSNGFIIF